MTPARRTSRSWRVAASGALLGAVGLGAAAARTLSAAGIVAIGAAVVAAYVVPLARASRRPPLEPLSDAALPAGSALPTVTVLVAGRDEAGVLPNLVADVAAQDHRDADGAPRFELIVVDDRSLDGTAGAVRDAAERARISAVTRVVRRGPPPEEGAAAIAAARLPDGKGAALTSAQPQTYRGEVVAVLDADARIAPDFLRRAASYFARGADAITCRRRILVEGHAGLARSLAEAQDDEQTADGEIQRGRWALGGCSEFRGNGIILRRDRLAEVGGWRAEALVEDLDLSSRLAARLGIRVGWALDVVVWEEAVVRLAPLWRQRLRWAEGIVRRQLALTAEILASPRLSVYARFDYLAYSSQTLLPVSLLGAVLGGAVFHEWRPALGLGAIYVGAGIAVAFDALRWTRAPDGQPLSTVERAVRAVRVTLFASHWLAALAAGWGRVAFGPGEVRYEKMAHAGAPSGWRPAAGGAQP